MPAVLWVGKFILVALITIKLMVRLLITFYVRVNARIR